MEITAHHSYNFNYEYSMPINENKQNRHRHLSNNLFDFRTIKLLLGMSYYFGNI